MLGTIWYTVLWAQPPEQKSNVFFFPLISIYYRRLKTERRGLDVFLSPLRLPEMKELKRMIRTGELDPERTIDHLKEDKQHGQR